MPGGNEKIVVRIDGDLEEIIPEFMELTRKDVKSIDTALKGNDFETIRKVAHTLKGSGGGYGFDAISEMGLGIEQAAKGGDGGAVRKWIDELANYLDRVEIIYE
jgi:HPt (histidine-containing phosphotransfer) domain-containing protein